MSIEIPTCEFCKEKLILTKNNKINKKIHTIFYNGDDVIFAHKSCYKYIINDGDFNIPIPIYGEFISSNRLLDNYYKKGLKNLLRRLQKRNYEIISYV